MMIRVLKITTHSLFSRFNQFGMDIYDVFVIKSLKEENLGIAGNLAQRIFLVDGSEGTHRSNVFVNPNEQRQACLISAMARKRRMVCGFGQEFPGNYLLCRHSTVVMFQNKL